MSKIVLPPNHLPVLRQLYSYLKQDAAPKFPYTTSISELAGTQPSLKLGEDLLRCYKTLAQQSPLPPQAASPLTSAAAQALARPSTSSPTKHRENATNNLTNPSNNATRIKTTAHSTATAIASDPNPSPLAALHHTIRTCKQCHLHKRRQHLPLQPHHVLPIMVLWDIINWSDHLHNKLFTTPAGTLLKKILHALKLSPETCYLTTAIKCSCVEEISNQLAPLRVCLGHFHKEIELVKPQLIIAFGEDTYRLLTQHNDFTSQKGTLQSYRSIPILYTHHPRELVNEPTLKKETWEALKVILGHITAIQEPYQQNQQTSA